MQFWDKGIVSAKDIANQPDMLDGYTGYVFVRDTGTLVNLTNVLNMLAGRGWSIVSMTAVYDGMGSTTVLLQHR